MVGAVEPGCRSHFSLQLMSVGDEISDARRILCGELGKRCFVFLPYTRAVRIARRALLSCRAFAEGIELSFGSVGACAGAQLFLSITSAVTEFAGVFAARIVARLAKPFASLTPDFLAPDGKRVVSPRVFYAGRSVPITGRERLKIRRRLSAECAGDVHRTEHCPPPTAIGQCISKSLAVICRGVPRFFDLNLGRSIPGSGRRRALPRMKPLGGSVVGAPPSTHRIPPARLK